MTRIYNNLIGSYIPSFFEMNISTDSDDLSIDKLSDRDVTILFHEYIHFLQDFTTIYGLSAIYTHSEYIRSVINRIYKYSSKKFYVPFKIEDNSDNVFLNKTISRFTFGDNSEINEITIDDINITYDELPPNEYIKEIPNITLIVNKGDYVTFGAIAIMENMAYIMERCCSPRSYEKSPEFPYQVAEKVAEFYSPEFANDKYKVLALCDISLHSSNPGVFFVKVMKGIAENRISFETPESVYDYLYTLDVYDYGTFEQKTFLDAYKQRLIQIQHLLKEYIKNMPIIKSYHKWIDGITNFSLKWRESDRYLLLNMARHQDLSTNRYWANVIHEVGTPLMSNKKGHYFKIPPHGSTEDMDVELFRAIREIELLFESGSVECSMYNWCKISNNKSINNLCKRTPWKKSTEGYLCPYALLWRHWKLSSYTPIKQ